MIRGDLIGPELLSDPDLLAEDCAGEADAGGTTAADQRHDALTAEIERRHLDL